MYLIPAPSTAEYGCKHYNTRKPLVISRSLCSSLSTYYILNQHCDHWCYKVEYSSTESHCL